MADMVGEVPLKLPQLQRSIPMVDPKTGLPTISTLQWLQQYAQAIMAEFGAVEAAAAAQAAADSAEASAATATTAAESAQTSADTAQSSADGANSVAALTASGVTPNPLTATDAGSDAKITVAAHTRVYGDGSTLSIAGPVDLTGRAYSTLYFVYYDDPTRADTTPSYQTTTSEATAAQTGDRHLVGMVLTPAAAAPPNDGDYVRPPGVGGIIP